MANGNNSAFVTWILKLVYAKTLSYLCEHPELTGEYLRERLRVFGSAPNEAILNRLLAIARTRCGVHGA
jgi:hypothetical protein